MTTQDLWCFCTQCYCLFWYGYPTAGACAGGGGQHSPFHWASWAWGTGDAASSVNFELQVASTGPPPSSPGSDPVTSPPNTQDNWRFCTKCYSLFFYGLRHAGVCPGGGSHSPLQSAGPPPPPPGVAANSSWDMALQIASTSAPAASPGGGGGASSPGTQGNWRFCTRCYSLFWYGYPTAGICIAAENFGGPHSPLQSDSFTGAGTSWDFELPVASTTPPAINFQMQYQLMDEWCWIACATSICLYYRPYTTWTQCELMADQLKPPWSTSGFQGFCCPDPSLIASTPGLAAALENPYLQSSLYALQSVNTQLDATPTGVCNHTGDIGKALAAMNLNNGGSGSSVSFSDLASQLAEGNPVCIGINWPVGSHQIVASGAEDPDTLVIEDPIYGRWVGPYQALATAYQGSGTWAFTAYTQP